MARKAQAWDMKVLYHNRTRLPADRELTRFSDNASRS